MYHFCTYFDSNYVFLGLTLYDSLRRNCGEFNLHVCCLDDRVYEILNELDKPDLKPFKLSDVEAFDPEFAATKSTRNIVEYYFTMSPVLPLFLFDRYSDIDMLTYLDSDLLFYADPAPVFDEMGDASLLLIGHRFPPELKYREKFGIYNLQFQPYRRDDNTATCLHWWRKSCIAWCYDRLEDGKFADQKYLEQWPDRFDGVHILKHRGAGLAPWNWSMYDLKLENGKMTVDGQELIFYHFQGFRVLGGHFISHNLGSYGHIMNKKLREFFYADYYRRLLDAEAGLRNIPAAQGLSLRSKLQRAGFSRLRGYLSALKHHNLMRVKI